MTQHYYQPADLQYFQRQHPKAKGIKLKIQREGLVLVSKRPLNSVQAARIIRRNLSWITKQLDKQSEPQPLSSLKHLYVSGHKYYLNFDSNYDFQVQNNYIYLQNTFVAYQAFKNWLMRQAKRYLLARTNQIASMYNFTYNKIVVKSHTTRWGSCSNKKNINLNWRLVLAPTEVSDYVIIHELAHTIHLNHSAEFWQLVQECVPNYKQHKKWLQKEGNGLYLFEEFTN